MEFAENQRQSAMGVSLDEEMSDLLKYKFAYNASSKTLNAIDEMLEIIINRMGRVGR
jgi:flagellar hook-associated protein 1